VSQGFEIFTLFPEAVAGFLGAGLMGKAIAAGHIDVHTTSFREYTTDKHRTVDDTPYGGGAGMLLKPGPVVAALEDVAAKRGPMHTVMLTPAAPTFDQQAARRLAQMPRIGLLCGRYEGFDDRVRGHVDESLSIGDFVLNGGEVAALAMVEAIARLRDGVLGNPDSVADESFSASASGEDVWLEPPHYTRPEVFAGKRVPEILLGGNHQAIAHYRLVEAWRRTWNLRPELRPRRSLSNSQPVYAVMPSDATERPNLRTALAQFGVIWLPRELDPKRIRKRLTRKHGQAPRWVGLTSGNSGCGDVPPVTSSVPALLDLLTAIRSLEPQTPLIFVVDPAIISGSVNEGFLTTVVDDTVVARKQRWPATVEAAISLSKDACRLTDSELAQRSRIYESSQPRVPTEWIFLYLSRVLTQLRQP